MPSAAFEAALPFILRWEGGFVDHPNDPRWPHQSRRHAGLLRRLGVGDKGCRSPTSANIEPRKFMRSTIRLLDTAAL